ncbi:NPCBM/NEW2 domain-containing protein [Deinococcus apachensis]|uniref:NPCBM/NEW2 domain-containing protein n=1 Tax=Deinococcus apachensis TaxID=309886 RepID=UPI00036A4D69|nr:NPCBM/NEW2 domain-containing protein [Deinococcus apachensis]
MRRGQLGSFLVPGLSFLLFACGQGPDSAATDPYAGNTSYPWSYAAPAGNLTAQRLTPGWNNLYYEPILAARNSWGPVELNRSNGEQAAGDGRTLTLNGRTYARGYGTHASSELRFRLGGTNAAQCTRFTADIGVDDEVGSRGSVVFQVYLDGQKAYDSGTMTGASATKRVDLDITGKGELRLVVTDAGNGISYDHADWAGPMVFCERRESFYRFHFEPQRVSARDGETVTATLIVTDEDISGEGRPPSGPISFRLRIFNKSGGGTALVEPERLYTASTFPARFPVRLYLNVDHPEFTDQRIAFYALLEGYDFGLLDRRFDLFWTILP